MDKRKRSSSFETCAQYWIRGTESESGAGVEITRCLADSLNDELPLFFLLCNLKTSGRSGLWEISRWILGSYGCEPGVAICKWRLA